MLPAHPRSRGENGYEYQCDVDASGSSPLTRGKPPQDSRFPCPLRLIPAHAGKTMEDQRDWREHAAHPRSRGENLEDGQTGLAHAGSSPLTRGKPVQQGALGLAAGSSPLTRGKQVGAVDSLSSWRLIPAHAGKTSVRAGAERWHKAHPRSRGENWSRRTPRSLRIGSSPLTRGKRGHRGGVEALGRLIPAHAGKTSQSAQAAAKRAAHPRSRGENLIGAVRTLVVTGSSPLTRGKLDEAGANLGGDRLIPAHAGKTRRGRCLLTQCTAHPRSRGENEPGSVDASGAVGSSPLTRGKRVTGCPRDVLLGLIPAHAGKTSRAVIPCFWAEAHPRSRGESQRRP